MVNSFDHVTVVVRNRVTHTGEDDEHGHLAGFGWEGTQPSTAERGFR